MQLRAPSFLMGATAPCFLLTFAILLSFTPAAYTRYSSDFYATGGAQNVRFINNDHECQLVLDNKTASGIASRNMYLFGSFDMSIKLVHGNSAGTVTAYYFSSETQNRDEIDFEFLGNVTGQPYILQTNVFWNGTGEREQRIYLWFDPTRAYHTYSVLWNTQHIIISVDGIPIRVVLNKEELGVPYLEKQPMGIFASIWDGSIWATRGGRDKINWKKSPFIASFGRYRFDACDGSTVSPNGNNSCPTTKWWNNVPYQTLSTDQESKLQWVKANYMEYNYCTDPTRFPTPPFECSFEP